MSYDRVKNSGNTAIYLNPLTLIMFLLRVLKEPCGGNWGYEWKCPCSLGISVSTSEPWCISEEKDNVVGNQGTWCHEGVKRDTEERWGEEQSSSY